MAFIYVMHYFRKAFLTVTKNNIIIIYVIAVLVLIC